MKPPAYIKIPAEALTSIQFAIVHKALLPKFGPKLPLQLTGSFAFTPDGETFVGAWFA